MLRWLGPRKAPEPPDCPANHIPSIHHNEQTTDDPLAAFDINHRDQKPIYSVSRSVLLPRVTLKNTACNSALTYTAGEGVNPLYEETRENNNDVSPKSSKTSSRIPSAEKSSSSGYVSSHVEGSSIDHIYCDQTKLREDAVTVLEQNPSFVKSIKMPGKAAKINNNIIKSVPSSGSSAGGTLTTIPEGRVDLPIPKPIWPRDLEKYKLNYDSLVDDALLLYTSLNYVPDNCNGDERNIDVSVKDILVELFNNINATMDGSTGLSPEEMLKAVNEKIASSIEALKISTEEEMRKLCINLSNCRKINSVLRAFSNSSSSGNSSQSSPEWSSGRARTLSSDTDDIYQNPSGSSSSGFSDYLKDQSSSSNLPVFTHEDIGSVPNGVRNAMIYGTLYRPKSSSVNLKIKDTNPKKNSLIAVNDNKPSVWEQYYGVKAAPEGEVKYAMKPTDVPLFPGGRPEADFTLDVPRSEMLLKKMKKDKKWRCRCRLLTSFLGLIFFLLSVMAVSLMLTRGKRMFGSMM